MLYRIFGISLVLQTFESYMCTLFCIMQYTSTCIEHTYLQFICFLNKMICDVQILMYQILQFKVFKFTVLTVIRLYQLLLVTIGGKMFVLHFMKFGCKNIHTD